MARDEQDAPDIPDPYQADLASQRLADRVARADAVEVLDFTAPEDGSQSAAFQPLHEGRVVRSAGRMVLGARVPTPTASAKNDMRGPLEPSQLFSSGNEGRRRSLSGGAAVVMACAVAVGSTAVLTNALNTSIERENGGGSAAFDAPASPAEGQPSSSPTPTASSSAEPQAAQMASLSPAAVSQPAAVAEPGIIRVRQDAPGLVIEDVSGKPGAEIPLRIEVGQSDTEEYSFLMFRGLPAEISLSAGFRLKDSWAVSLRDVANLALVSPPDYEARFQVEVLLIKGRNTPADSRLMTVSLQQGGPSTAPRTVVSAPRQEAPPQRILTAAPTESKPLAEPKKAEAPAPSRAAVQPKAEAPRPKLAAVQPQAEAPAPSLAAVQPKAEAPKPSLAAVQPRPEAPASSPAPAQPKKLAISPETEAAMLNRAAKMLGLGDVSSARLLFEHIARKGSGKAAMALARTFDPAFFGSIQTRGLKPDREKAKQWYAVAAELGEDDARSRLDVLSAR